MKLVSLTHPSSLGLASLVLALGCGSGGNEQATQAAVQEPGTTHGVPSAPLNPPPPSAAPVERVEEAGFVLRSEVPGPTTVGTEGHFQIRLEARGGYHVNQEYPISIQLMGPAHVTFPRATLGRQEAAEFGESGARFDVAFTGTSAGEATVQAIVDFAVCTPESCMPDLRTLAIRLPVQ